MPIQDLPPKHCFDLREADPSLVHLDVRTPAEFAQGHPQGALNVPIMFRGPAGMSENPDFLRVAQGLCTDPARRVILSCAMGGRSRRAAEALEAHGYANLVNMRGGYSGARGPDGALREQGWSGLGLPVSQDPGQRSWESLSAQG
jgi:rhodanese-related sulfurtransferase